MLDEARKEEMLAVLIRNQRAYEAVEHKLTVRAVRRIGEAHAQIWKQVRAFYARRKVLPPRGTLTANLHQALAETPSLLSDEERQTADEFLAWAWDDEDHGADLSTSDVHVQTAIETCQEFLLECAALDTRALLLQDDTVPVDLSAELEATRREVDQITSLTGVDVDLPFPDNWHRREGSMLRSTGVAAIDDLIGGGWKKPEVVLFLAVTGSCKTVLTCHGVGQTILDCHADYRAAVREWAAGGHRAPKPKRPVVVLIFTEGTKDDYRIRLLSYMARVPWKRLAVMRDLEDLSDKPPGAVKDRHNPNVPGTSYELEEFREEIASGKFRTERQRVERVVPIANQHLVLLDCTDSEDSPCAAGSGGIPEIAGVLRSYFRRHEDVYPVAFWLDHVSALADRMAEAGGDDVDRKLQSVIKRIPLQAVDRITKPFAAPMLMTHQFSGAQNEKSIAARFHHAQAEGSKSVGKYVDFAICATPTDSSGISRFECTKHRREPPQHWITVQVVGQFNRLVRRHNLGYDPVSGGYVPLDSRTLGGMVSSSGGTVRYGSVAAQTRVGDVS
jgi:uncharacterized protein with HEPN domain